MSKLYFTFLILIPFACIGGGFQNNKQSTKGLGMGGMFTGICKDASSVFYNPAGIGIPENKFNLTIGDCFILPSTSYLSSYNGNVDMQKQNYFPFHLYASYKINKKLGAGLSINSPFGFQSKWDDNWEGRYVTQESSIKTTFYQPTLSYILNKKISIGAGFIIATEKIEDRKAYQNSGSVDITEDLNAKGSGYGFNIGAFFKLGDKARLGVDYRSSIKFDLKNGDATFTNVPSSLGNTIPSTTTFNSEMKLPDVLSIGFSYELSAKVMFGIEFNYTGWASVDTLNFNFPGNPNLNSRIDCNYKNVIAARIGAQYKATDKIPVRVGIAYDQSPVPDGCVSPALPDADKIIFSLGASYSLNKLISIDFAYAFESYRKREANYVAKEFSGTYKSTVNNFALSANFTFGTIKKSLHEK